MLEHRAEVKAGEEMSVSVIGSLSNSGHFWVRLLPDDAGLMEILKGKKVQKLLASLFVYSLFILVSRRGFISWTMAILRPFHSAISLSCTQSF